MSNSIASAVKQVRDEILAGESMDDAIDFIAGEAKLNVELLRRKVVESYGERVAEAANSAAVAQDLNKKVAARERIENLQFMQVMSEARLMGLVKF